MGENSGMERRILVVDDNPELFADYEFLLGYPPESPSLQSLEAKLFDAAPTKAVPTMIPVLWLFRAVESTVYCHIDTCWSIRCAL